MKNNHNGLAITALILGIVAIVLSFLPFINNAAFVIGLVAAVLGLIALIRHQPRGLAIAGLVLGILSAAITLMLQNSWSESINKAADDLSGDNTEEILKDDLKVDLGQFSVTTDEYGITSTELPVSVQNISGDSLSFDIHIECVDSTGARLADDTVYVSGLAAGQSIQEKAFEYVPEDKLDAVQQGTFQIVEVSKY